MQEESKSMLPIILNSASIKNQENFVKKFIAENAILPYYIFRIEPEKEEISIEQVRQLKKEMIVPAKSKKLFIINDFDNASYEAQNALLKTFEENTKNNLFILLSANTERIIPTVRSRAKIVFLDRSKNKTARNEISEILDKIVKDENYSFFSEKSFQTNTKNEALIMIDEVIFHFKEKLKEDKVVYIAIIKKAIRLKALLQNNNLNPQLTIDNLLIFIVKAFRMKL
jgi:DNA polymerase III gamma/tau subunit